MKKLFSFHLIKNYDDDEMLFVANILLSGLWYIFLLIMFFGSFGVITEQQRGLKVTLGKAHSEITQPGVYVKLPIITQMKKYDSKIVREDSNLSSYTKDIQTATINASVSYQINREKIREIYSEYGDDWYTKLVWNNLNQSAKDIIGKYNAETLVAEREEAAQKILKAAKEAVKDLPVDFIAFQIIDIDYNDNFEDAVEQKVIAEQAAKESENKTKQVEQEAKQRLISAKAEAESMRIRSQALSQNPRLVDYEAVQKWDGKLPTMTMGNSVPFINIK